MNAIGRDHDMHMIGPRVFDPRFPSTSFTVTADLGFNDFPIAIVKQNDWIKQTFTPPIGQQRLWRLVTTAIPTPSSHITLQPCAVNCPCDEVGQRVVVHVCYPVQFELS